MATMDVALNGDSSNGKPYSKATENGILPTASGGLDMRDAGNVVSDELEMCEEIDEEEPPMGEIKQDLDTLTASGSAINDLEMQLTRVKVQYRRTLNESREKMDALRKKLGTSIKKSEPFIEIWRKARQIQDLSNKAAARFDKANSQHTAAKEMIRMAESQLSTASREGPDPSSPSPIDLAWQEMLNHATIKVVETEKERRESEEEHLHIMQECTRVMEEYKNIEKRLRTHIVKSRPYYEERYRCNQKLQQLRLQMQTLENKVASSKKAYSAALKKLEVLNTEIHRRRQSTMSRNHLHLEHRKSFSTGNSPEPMRTKLSMRAASSGVSMEGSDTESVNSLYLGDLKNQFSGSTGSLPSIGESSMSEVSPCPTPEPIADEDNPIVIRCGKSGESRGHMDNGLRGDNLATSEKVNSERKNSMVESNTPTTAEDCETNLDPVEVMANKLVEQTLTSVVAKLKEQSISNPGQDHSPSPQDLASS